MALAARGLGREEIAVALDAEPATAEVERAVALLGSRDLPLGDDAARGRAFALLARSGYPAEVAYEAIRLRARLTG